MVDFSKAGKIGKEELKFGLGIAGSDLSEHDFLKLWKKVDKDKSHAIDFSEFLEFVFDLKYQRAPLKLEKKHDKMHHVKKYEMVNVNSTIPIDGNIRDSYIDALNEQEGEGLSKYIDRDFFDADLTQEEEDFSDILKTIRAQIDRLEKNRGIEGKGSSSLRDTFPLWSPYTIHQNSYSYMDLPGSSGTPYGYGYYPPQTTPYFHPGYGYFPPVGQPYQQPYQQPYRPHTQEGETNPNSNSNGNPESEDTPPKDSVHFPFSSSSSSVPFPHTYPPMHVSPHHINPYHSPGIFPGVPVGMSTPMRYNPYGSLPGTANSNMSQSLPGLWDPDTAMRHHVQNNLLKPATSASSSSEQQQQRFNSEEESPSPTRRPCKSTICSI